MTDYGGRAATRVFELLDTPAGYPRVQWLGVTSIDADAIAEGRGSEPNATNGMMPMSCFTP